MISHDGVNLWIRSPISSHDRPLPNAEQAPTSPPVRQLDREFCLVQNKLGDSLLLAAGQRG